MIIKSHNKKHFRKSFSKDKKINKKLGMNRLTDDLVFDIFNNNNIVNKMKSVSKNFSNINTYFSELILDNNNKKVDKMIKVLKDINDEKIVYNKYFIEKYKKIDDTEIMTDKTKIYIKSINLNDNQLKKLPEKIGYNLKVGGNLDLSDNGLTKLPEKFGYNLTIEGDLDLSSNYLTLLPETFGNIKIKGNLNLYGNKLTKEIIPESVITLVNDIFMKKCIYIFKKSILGLHYKINNKFIKKINEFISSDLINYFLNNFEIFSVDDLINDFFENIFYENMMT